MHSATVITAGFVGIDGVIVNVQARLEPGLPTLTFGGLLASGHDESRERVRAALQSLGLPLPGMQQTVSAAVGTWAELAAIDAPGVDLAIAIAVLVAHGVVPAEATRGVMLWGELSYAGELLPARGGLIAAELAHREGIKRMIAPHRSGADVPPKLAWAPAQDLAEVVALLRGEVRFDERVRERPTWRREAPPSPHSNGPDMADIRGLAQPCKALEIAAAGGCNLLLLGPPGVGKTMLARRLGGLLPDLELDTAIVAGKIQALALRRTPEGLPLRPPIRMPHHTVSEIGMFGGNGRPGEVSLAHGGVLFLDELPEFSHRVIARMRGVAETGSVEVTHRRVHMSYPARMQVIAAMNLCPCGFATSSERACTCSPEAVRVYQKRIAPLLDVLHIAVDITPARDDQPCEPTATIRARVERARQIRLLRDALDDGDRRQPVPPAVKCLNAAAREHGIDPLLVDATARVIQDLDERIDPDDPITLEAVEQAVAFAMPLAKLPRTKERAYV